MDDTKKLIEKYKRELMELGKASAAERRSDECAESGEPPKAPQIIGYVADENSDFSSVFDKYIAKDDAEDGESCGESPEEEQTDSPECREGSEPEESGGKTADEDGESGSDAAQLSFDERMTGTGEPAASFDDAEFADYDDFREQNPGSGTLEFRVFTAEQALPVADAAITVTVKIGGIVREMFACFTDGSGNTEPRELPAPLKELSQQERNRVRPFSVYDAAIEKNGYDTMILRDIPIFDGVQSVQRAAMIPSADAGTAEEVPDGEQ